MTFEGAHVERLGRHGVANRSNKLGDGLVVLGQHDLVASLNFFQKLGEATRLNFYPQGHAEKIADSFAGREQDLGD